MSFEQEQPLDRTQLQFLIQALTSVADNQRTIAHRREALVLSLAERVGGDLGHWAWGRGRPERSSPTVVANIPFGFTDEEMASMFAFGMGEVCQFHFIIPQFQRLRGDNMLCCRRCDIIADEDWNELHPLWSAMESFHCRHWLNVVRYSANDTWSQVLVFRRSGQPDFTLQDLKLMDVAVSTINWLWAPTQDTGPGDEIEELTERQRNVMLLLLSGLTRKMIARRLGISEPTVNDHVNAIYSHFQVQSSMELAALFLRSQ